MISLLIFRPFHILGILNFHEIFTDDKNKTRYDLIMLRAVVIVILLRNLQTFSHISILWI